MVVLVVLNSMTGEKRNKHISKGWKWINRTSKCNHQ